MNDSQTSRRRFEIEIDPDVELLGDESQLRTLRIRLVDGPPIVREEVDFFMMRIVTRVIIRLNDCMVDPLFNFLGFGEQAFEIQYIDPGSSEQRIRDELIKMLTITLHADVQIA